MQDLFIDSDDALGEHTSRLADSDWLAVDTEFVRERTYYAEACLLQLADRNTVACVDLLAISDPGPVLALLADPRIVKVFHSASQDLEVLSQLGGRVPEPIFDTQVAATLLGYGDQVGYAALAKGMLNVDLDKSHSRTDWRQRPLTDEQIEYAGDDVRYLREIYLRQHETLSELGRLDWLKADFAVLTDPARYRPDPESAWTRIKRVNTLKGVQLAVARSLAAWRECEAMTSDRPRRWVLADEPLLDLARRCPAGEAELGRIRGLNAGQVSRHGQALLSCIREARDTPRADWPQPEMRIRLEPLQEALADAAMAIVRLCGHEHAVSPGSLASRRDVEALIAGRRDASGLLRGWRYRIAGQAVERFLAGTSRLQVSGQRLTQYEFKPD